MRALFIMVVGGVLITSCLPWDPRADGPIDGGAGGSAGGGSVAGGSAGGGSAGGGSVAGGSAGGGSVAGGSAAGGTAGGRSGVVTPYADGGCLTFDGGTRCHAFCVPGPPAQLSNGESCCLDDECASGQCFGPSPGRLCAAANLSAREDAGCGDATDCAAQGAACDRNTQRCSTVIAAVLGPPEPCFIGPTATSCSFGGLNGPFCALPGTRNQSMGSNPCCYDRTDAGAPISCLTTGTCYCLPTDDAGVTPCGAYEGASCPF